MNVIALPAFSDNYIWMLCKGQQAVVIDPGEAKPVINTLEKWRLELQAVLTTHHHADHVGGVDALRPYLPQAGLVYGPTKEKIPEPYIPLNASSHLTLMGLSVHVLDVPGHTAGHIAYYIPEQIDGKGEQVAPMLFCGDALFSIGCGRIFEGTAKQTLAAMDLFSSLPKEAQVYCGHEYTLSNLRFALAVEPDNRELKIYADECETKRAQGISTLPSNIGLELRLNPFLRSREPQVIRAVQQINARARSEVGVFAALRHWKDNY